jgi:uroporphyrinogen-III synthase
MRILVLRSVDEEFLKDEEVDVLVTHRITPIESGIASAREFEPRGARLIVSSRTTIRVLVEAGAGDLFSGPFVEVLAAGSETARALRAAGSSNVRVPSAPGARGLLADLPGSLAGQRVLWPRASDAEDEPLAEMRSRGAAVSAPIVYEKRRLAALDGDRIQGLLDGRYRAVAVSSLSALDALLDAVRKRNETIPESIHWGVLGPETARAFRARGLPLPVVPERPALTGLIQLLRSETRT